MRGGGAPRQVVWTSSKPPGVEYCTVSQRASGWTLAGSVVRRFEEGVGVVSYSIETDQAWKTSRTVVEEVLGGRRFVLEMESGRSGWSVGGRKVAELEGCLDVDLEASPVTNTLPIRREEIRVGERVGLTAAWVRFPSLKVEPLRQSYERVGRNKYRYASASGFTSEIEVDEFGLVKRYGQFWIAV
jgi:hypothetical protein